VICRPNISVIMPYVTVKDPMEAFPLEFRELGTGSNVCKVAKHDRYPDLYWITDWPAYL
jgi:hypothetical protein